MARWLGKNRWCDADIWVDTNDKIELDLSESALIFSLNFDRVSSRVREICALPRERLANSILTIDKANTSRQRVCVGHGSTSRSYGKIWHSKRYLNVIDLVGFI